MNSEVLDLIERHDLEKSDFYNANGSPVSHIKGNMKRNSKLWAYNTTPCQNQGHTTRSRSGHCILCDPAKIAFQKRSSRVKLGYLYIFCSIEKQYTKVGMTTEKPKIRIAKLNSRGVGGTNDWEIAYYIKISNPNEKEILIQQKLGRYKVLGEYYQNTESSELFRCSFEKAFKSFKEVITTNKLKEGTLKKNKIQEFRFRNLASLNR